MQGISVVIALCLAAPRQEESPAPVSVRLPPAARAQEQEPPPPPAPAPLLPDDWEIELLPDKIIYRPYLADPRQARTGSKVQFPVRTRHNDIKIENTLGSTRPLASWSSPSRPEEEAEFFIEAAVFSRFDIQEGWDMDAADYRFGFPFAYRYHDVALKFHVWHLTSHLGDEFISREGRERDSYHINEAAVGFSWQADPHWRIYTELGAGIYTGPATESGRAQLGTEWVGPAWKGHLSPFVAADLQTRNEIGWSWNASLAGGVMVLPKSGGNGLRLQAEYFRGHDQQTQFKSYLEHYYALGIAADS